jgi:MoxR-like ATPase
MLLDRLPERAALSRLLEAARSGRSGVRGEPGVGKTALLEHAVQSAGMRLARAPNPPRPNAAAADQQ